MNTLPAQIEGAMPEDIARALVRAQRDLPPATTIAEVFEQASFYLPPTQTRARSVIRRIAEAARRVERPAG